MVYLQKLSYLYRFEERLEFITSIRTIALGVHYIAIATSMKTSSELLSDGSEDASYIIDKLVNAFRYLPNLNKINNHGYTMTSRIIRQIYQMPQLQFLSINIVTYHDDDGTLLKNKL